MAAHSIRSSGKNGLDLALGVGNVADGLEGVQVVEAVERWKLDQLSVILSTSTGPSPTSRKL